MNNVKLLAPSSVASENVRGLAQGPPCSPGFSIDIRLPWHVETNSTSGDKAGFRRAFRADGLGPGRVGWEIEFGQRYEHLGPGE